jgi:hypothetical protein
MKRALCKVWLALFVAGAAGMLAGCATDDSDNLSRLPQDPPQHWEGSLPSNINQGR